MSPSEGDIADTFASPSAGEPTSAPGRDEHHLRILTAIRRIIRSVEIYSRRLAMGHGITAPQLVCLGRVVESDGLSLKDLAAQVHLSPSTMVGIVDRLEAKGLVQRERSRSDRRIVLITATPSGLQMVSDAPSPLQDALAKALDELPELERVAIALSLERVVDLMEIQRLDASPILETGAILEPLQDVPEMTRTARDDTNP